MAAVPCQEGPVSCISVKHVSGREAWCLMHGCKLPPLCSSLCGQRSRRWVLRVGDAQSGERVPANTNTELRLTMHPLQRLAQPTERRHAHHVARGSRMGAASGAGAGVRQGRAKHRHRGKEAGEKEAPGPEDKQEGEVEEEWGMSDKEPRPLLEQENGQYRIALRSGGELVVQVRAVKQQEQIGQDTGQPPTAPPLAPPALVAALLEDLQATVHESTAHVSRREDAAASEEEKSGVAVHPLDQGGNGAPWVDLDVTRTGAAPQKGRAGLEAVVVRSAEAPLVFRLQNLYATLLKLPGPHFFLAAFVAPLALSAAFTGAYLLDPDGVTLNGQGLRTRLHAHQGAAADKREGGEVGLPHEESEAKGRGLQRTAEPGSPLAINESSAPPLASLREDFSVEAAAARLPDVGAPSTSLEAGSVGWLVFTVLMFSVALSTSLQPEVVPVSPYALLLANLNALLAQLLFVFLSGAVFARLSQPSRPIQAARVAVITPPAPHTAASQPTRLLMTRFVLTGPPPCELIDAKLDLTLAYDTRDAEGHHFRAQQALRLVRSEVAHLQFGFNVRHPIDADSPFAQRSRDGLAAEDACLTLSVVGVDRSSMQTVFLSQNYFVVDDEIKWDAEYEDVIILKEDGSKLVDHTKLDKYRRVHGF